MTRPPGYHSWDAMNRRCRNSSNPSWRHYGGRGIGVYLPWRISFANFIRDMGPPPSPQYSIDRYPDNDGDYEPGNCRWATRSQQALNTRKVVMPGTAKKGNRWQAQIDVAGKNVYLGLFRTREEASATFLRAKAIRDGEIAP